MDCPYCYSSIHEDASICPHCRSDLVTIKPLLKRLSALEERVESLALGTPSATVSQELTSNEAEQVLAMAAEADKRDEAAAQWKEMSWRRWVIGTCVLVLSLIFLHWLLVFIYDIRPLVLRVVTLLVPMLTGYLLLRRHIVQMTGLVIGSAAVGISSVLGMVSVTGALDGVPILPSSVREWREVIEYALGIALGLFSSGLAVRFLHDLLVNHSQSRKRYGKWFFLEKNPDGSVKAAKFAMEVSKFVNAAAPVASGATALYAGLKSVLGN